MILYKKRKNKKQIKFVFIITGIHKNQRNKNTNDYPKKL